METFYPLLFQPILQERIWGGRRLETLYGKKLPPNVPIGESWEVSDRPEANSVVTNGPLQGETLHGLMTRYHDGIMGKARDTKGRFPLLVKIIDAHEDLSVQVHPSDAVAVKLGGESKKELWLVTHAEPRARIFLGLKQGATKERLADAIAHKQAASLLHSCEVKEGDSALIPPGGIHALGAGVMIFEFQQNSDTIYRIYDWDRVDAQGKPRELHLENAMKSICFDYVEPSLISSKFSRNPVMSTRYLLNDAAFVCDEYQVKKGQRFYIRNIVPIIMGVVSGIMVISGGGQSVSLHPGEFCLLPAGLDCACIETITRVYYLMGQPQANK